MKSTNLDINRVLGTRCISYYASSRSKIDNKHSYEFWIRGKCIRIVADKSFGRGDTLQINSITDTTSGVNINVSVLDEWEEGYPVLNFVSGRLIYNKWINFECVASDGIQILKKVEQVLSDNYSLGFIVLVYKSGKITCTDTMSDNNFDIIINLDWE